MVRSLDITYLGDSPVAKKPSGPRKSKGTKPAKAPRVDEQAGAPFNDQDPKRRLGNFGGAGEHPRQGGRTSGIVGQTKQKNRTDKGPKKK